MRARLGGHRPPPAALRSRPRHQSPHLSWGAGDARDNRKRLKPPQQQPRVAGRGARSRGRPPAAGVGPRLLDGRVPPHSGSPRSYTPRARGVSATSRSRVSAPRLTPLSPRRSWHPAPRLDPPRGSCPLTPRRWRPFLPPPAAGAAPAWGPGTSAHGAQKAAGFVCMRPACKQRTSPQEPSSGGEAKATRQCDLSVDLCRPPTESKLDVPNTGAHTATSA